MYSTTTLNKGRLQKHVPLIDQVVTDECNITLNDSDICCIEGDNINKHCMYDHSNLLDDSIVLNDNVCVNEQNINESNLSLHGNIYNNGFNVSTFSLSTSYDLNVNNMEISISVDGQEPFNVSDNCNHNVSSSTDGLDPLIDILTKTRLNNPKSLIIAHVNINSLKKEECSPIDYFKHILNKHLIDILCISETKLDESIPDKRLDNGIDFKLYRKDRESNSGGLCIWARSDIPQQRMKHLEFACNTYHIECMVIKFNIKKESWFLILAYKNPKVSNNVFIPKLCCLYEDLISKGKEIVLLGDLNIDMLHTENDLSNDLCDIYGLTNIIKQPTCFKSAKGTLVDPIIVKSQYHFKHAESIPCAYSDFHNLVCCVTKMHVQPKRPFKTKYRSLKEFDVDSFKMNVQQIPFHVSEVFEDECDKYWFKKKLFTDVLDMHAPIKIKSMKEEQLPYMTSALRKQMYKRNMLKNNYKKDPKNDSKWNAYRIQRNLVVKMRKHALRNYFRSSCSTKSGNKGFFDAFGPFISSKPKARRNIMLKENGEFIVSTQDLCEIFAFSFSTIANTIGIPDEIDMNDENFLQNIIEKHKDHESINAIRKNVIHGKTFSFKPVSVDYVKKILSSLKANKSTGYDNIPPRMVKLCAEELSVTITESINSAMKNNQFPSDLKKADLVPLFKKADDMLKENYRPVSILPVFSKVFEIVIADQLMEFFKYIFNDLLCAYRKKYSTEHLLIELLEHWKWALDNDLFCGTILMDLTKAFDCMPHGLLVAKMHAYGVDDDACKFICSYLSERYQRVKISNEHSSWMPLLKGIPQGSCLGPFLFNVFINDLFYFMETCLLLNYADDNSLSKFAETIKALIKALARDAENSIKWFKDNNMEANPTKFQGMIVKPFTSKEDLPEFIDVMDNKIKVEDDVKLLGATIDNKLKFDKHINIICRNASRQLNIMYRFKGIFDFNLRETIHNTFIMSNFNYCPIVWHFCSKTSTMKMEKLQERALRFLLNDKTSSYGDLLKKCSSTTLHLKRLKSICTEVFKSLKGLNPKFMNDMFEEKEIPYNLRDQHLLVQPKFKKITYGKNTFKYFGSHLWNLLPNDLKGCTSLDSFKDMISTWEGPNCQCLMCNRT